MFRCYIHRLYKVLRITRILHIEEMCEKEEDQDVRSRDKDNRHAPFPRGSCFWSHTLQIPPFYKNKN